MTSVNSKSLPNGGFQIKVTGINQTLRKLDLLLDGIEQEVDELLLNYTKDYHKEVQDSAPKDWGTYKENWKWNQTNIGRFVIWNDVSMVYRPGIDVHYSYYLVNPNPWFARIVNFSKHNYKYADPTLGIIHDLRQIRTIMTVDLEKKIR